MKLNNHLLGWFITLLLAIPAGAYAFRAPDRPQLPNYDKRQVAKRQRAETAEQREKSAKLRALVPGVRIDFEPVTESPNYINAAGAFLTGPGGSGKSVQKEVAAVYANDSYAAAKAFVASHSNLFGFGPEALDRAVVQRDTTASHNGVRTVIWEQRVDGIAVFGARFVSHTTKRGELINVSSQFLPDPELAARNHTADIQGLIARPPMSLTEAVALAARDVGESTTANDLSTPSDAVGDHTQTHKVWGPGLNGQASVSLVWLPVSKTQMRLCWEVIFTSRSRSEMFRILVDAQTGETLLRHSLTEYLLDATYRVYTNDSPSPFSPGWPTPNSAQPSNVPRVLVTLSSINATASPDGWVPDNGNEPLGNNVQAHTDTNADDWPDLPRPQGSPWRVFDFPLDLATQEPGAYQSASVVQLFYLNNWAHDRLYELGFTEAAGNFQNANFGRGGMGNDAVQADAQDGSGTDNANFSTPPDGSPPRMQMFLFHNPVPRRDGGLDGEIVIHEYAHGLSNRQVGGGGGISALQARGLGEGWSDFYALALLSEPGDDVNACYPAGAYASHKLGGSADTQNYYFGIRRYPYSTDLAKNPLTFKDIDPSQADYCNSDAPYHTGMFGSCTASSADEVHNQGEVWCVTLWDMRALLVARDGWAAGNGLALQLVTDGMLLAPPNPNFLQARDGILQADLVNTGGQNQEQLWRAFARRGMGFTATSPSSTTTAGVMESYDLPDDLRIQPLAGFISSGPLGGPFTITNQTLSLTNFGTNAISWVLNNTTSWLLAAPSDGTLLPGGSAAEIVVSLSTAAASLQAGIYSTALRFTNLNSGMVQTRAYMLRVGQPVHYTELFEVNDNDLAHSTLTFTPDASASYYAVCKQPAQAFPTDPGGGTVVVLDDDDSRQVNLSGAAVALYDQTNSVFYIGSNGYLTLNEGDNTYIESTPAHFSRPRISALFHDLLPVIGTVISWRQLADRVAVTYQGIADIMETGLNDFQIEWFFDGTIRLTYLRLDNRQNLVGLSAGTGVPVGFVETDLSDTGPCNPLLLSVPEIVTEGDGVLSDLGRVALQESYATNISVLLHSSDSSEVEVPAAVVIPAGQTEARFTLTVVDDAILDGTQTATIQASAPGLRSGIRSVRVNDSESASIRLILPFSVIEGQGTAEGTLELSATPASDLIVDLASSDTNALIVPPSVIVSSGKTSVLFAITVVDNFRPNTPQTVSIAATVAGWENTSQEVVVLDNPLPVAVFSNPFLITMQDSGPAAPYPASLTVSGLSGGLSLLKVTLTNLTHTYPDDIGVLLVAPTGTNIVLMSNAGGSTSVSGVVLTFDDSAPGTIPSQGPLVSGSFRPTLIAPGTWPAPAPSTARVSNLAAFNGSDPNGTWRLYVYDDESGDSGRINNGWYLTLATSRPPPRPLLVPERPSGDQVQFSFGTVPGHSYHVEYQEQLSSSQWLLLRTIAGDGGTKQVMEPGTAGARFYRVRVE